MSKRSLLAAASACLLWNAALLTSEEAAAAPVTAPALVKMFVDLDPWSHTQDYSAAAWKKAVRVALVVQKTNPQTVGQALDSFIALARKQPFNGDSEFESRVFILMRVVFDLPENAPASQRFSFKGWINGGAMVNGATANLAWPIAWTGHAGLLLAHYEGSEGKQYEAKAEYNYMRSHFPFRKLP
jgi:hypothetical protein